EAALELGKVSQRRVSLAQTVLRIGFPIKGRICLRAVHLRQLVELGLGVLVAVFIECLTAVVVQLRQAFEAFLFAIAFFLFAIALFLLTVPGFLLAVPFFLLLVLAVLLHSADFFVAVRVRSGLALRANGQMRRRLPDDGRGRPLRKARHRQQKRHYHPRSVSHHQYVSPAHALFLSPFAEPFGDAGALPDSSRCCSFLPTTRTWKRMPRASMRCRMPSNCAGVTCCGLCATSRSTRSSSS